MQLNFYGGNHGDRFGNHGDRFVILRGRIRQPVPLIPLEQSLSAYRNTSKSTRNLFVNLTLLNDTFQGGVKARVYLEVYNESGTQLGSTEQRDTPSAIPAGGSYLMTTSVDLGSLGNLRSAFSVRARCIPIEVTGNVAETSAATTVTDGPSPYT